MKKVKWAVMGSGGIARRRTIPEGIVPADNAELVSVYDVDAAINRETAEVFGVHASESVDELLNSQADAIYIATPANLHYEQALACAKAGKHVFCEKPLGLTVRQTQEMVRFFEDMNFKLGCAFMMRFHSQHQEALKLIQEGKIGRPVYARAQLSCWYPPIKNAWRQDPAQGGGGSLMDLGGHCIDLLEMFFGNVVKVFCVINNSVHDYKSEDSAVVTLFFENGAIGVVDTFFCIPDNSSKNVLELYGSGGSIIAAGTIGQQPSGDMSAFIEGKAKDYDADQARLGCRSVSISPEPVNMYKAEIEEFSRAVIEDTEPLNDANTGLKSQQILSACYESARAEKMIRVV